MARGGVRGGVCGRGRGRGGLARAAAPAAVAAAAAAAALALGVGLGSAAANEEGPPLVVVADRVLVAASGRAADARALKPAAIEVNADGTIERVARGERAIGTVLSKARRANVYVRRRRAPTRFARAARSTLTQPRACHVAFPSPPPSSRIETASNISPLRVGGHSRVIDVRATSAVVYPGLADYHTHVVAGGMLLTGRKVDLSGVSTKTEFVAAVKDAAGALEPGEWMLGGGWDASAFAAGEGPKRAWLDGALGSSVPALLHSHDMHSAVASSAALDAAGVDDGAVDPPGGSYARDSYGRLTGVLVDEAAAHVLSFAPPAPLTARLEAAHAASRAAAKVGATLLCDMTDISVPQEMAFADLQDVYASAASQSLLSTRVFAYAPLSQRAKLAALVKSKGYTDSTGMVSWGGLKAFFDGSLGSRSALFDAPYEGEDAVEGNAGLNVTSIAHIKAEARAGAEAGLSLAVHAIGDKAVREVSRSLRLVRTPPAHTGCGIVDKGTHRVEHVQHLPREWARGPHAAKAMRDSMGTLTASVQPLQYSDDKHVLARAVGDERASHSYAFASLAKSASRVAMGSDWPIAPLDPLAAMASAVLERAEAGDGQEMECVRACAHLRTRDAGQIAFAHLRGVLAGAACARALSRGFSWPRTQAHTDSVSGCACVADTRARLPRAA